MLPPVNADSITAGTGRSMPEGPCSFARSSTDAALRGLRITDTRYCRTELSAPWGLKMKQCPIVTFHFVAQGRCLLTGVGEDRWLERGEFIVFPRGRGHRLLSAPGEPAHPVLR